VIRAVVDTNIIVSGVLWFGVPGRVVDAVLDGTILSITSELILAELTRVLSRTKFEPKFSELGLTSASIITRIRRSSEIILPASIVDTPVRDPKDVMLLECAVAGAVDYLVSGDKDLVDLGSYRDIPILTPVEFLNRLAQSDPTQD
jgi:uncharacterized protein